MLTRNKNIGLVSKAPSGGIYLIRTNRQIPKKSQSIGLLTAMRRKELIRDKKEVKVKSKGGKK